MLINLKENLEMAEQGNYAIGAFNSPTLESARAVVAAAEELNAPIILQHAEVHFDINPLEVMGPILINLAKNASVPVTVHLDHGSSLETVKKAIEIGFNSVMIDASSKPYEENIEIVKEVVLYAHAKNVSVEAELGVIMDSTIGGEQTGGTVKENLKDFYTDPLIAKDFVARTNIDALAAAFGTVHGMYLEEPNLDFDRLNKIYHSTKKPVVMHGGSGLSYEEYINAINNGVRKINYYAYAANAGANAVKKYIEKNQELFYHDLTITAREQIKSNVKQAMKTFLNKN